MIKFGAHSYLFAERWSDSQVCHLETARALGLDGFEIGVGDDVPFTPAVTRARAEALGLELAISPGGLWPLSCDLSSADPAERAAGLAWHKKYVNLAGELGATAYAGCLYGHTGVVNRRPPTADEYAWIAEGLHALSEYARPAGVRVVIEPMSHFRTNLVNKPEQAIRLIEMAASPNLFLLLDTYHMVTEVRDYAAAARAGAKYLYGVHACENDRGAPGGGIIPWDAFLGALKAAGFDGWLTMEAYNSSVPGFAYQRGMFHNACPDPEAFVRQGMAFLKERLAEV